MTAQRKFAIALLLSLAVHALVLGTTRERLARPGAPGVQPVPLTVRIVEALREPAAVAATEPVVREPLPRIPPHVAAPRVAPPRALPKTEPAPAQRPAPPERAAQTRFDMAALIEARRAERRAAEQASEQEDTARSGGDPAAGAIQRNLVMSGDEGVGGIFQILYKGTSTATFAFNGWRPDTHRQWREVIEVTAPSGGDIDRAIVRSMIGLIRSHYEGDFQWESHRLGKVVVLSARIEDNGFLEEFLMREFFGTPLLKQARPR